MELLFTKTAVGLVPACEESSDWLRRKKMGTTILVEPREIRNGAFFKKFWALVRVGFDYWSDAVEPMQYKGEPVKPDFHRFRKDVTILAGFHKAIVNIKGEVRLEPESLQWSQMTEERFAQLYDAVIHVLLRKVFNGKTCPTWSEEELRGVANQILEFSH